MSTDIIFQQHACWTRNSAGIPIFLLIEQFGCNNVSNHRGDISRSWNARAFGTFRQVVANACKSARCIAGGSLRRGSESGNSYRSITPSGYVQSIIHTLRDAGELLGNLPVTVSAKSSWSSESEKQANVFNSARAVAETFGIEVKDDEVLFELANPVHVDAYLQFLQGNCSNPHTRMTVDAYCPERGVHRAPREEFTNPKWIPRLGVVCVYRKSYADAFWLPSDKPGVEVLQSWELAENIGEFAARAALIGDNPCAVFRALSKECVSAQPEKLDLTFSISERDKLSWTPLIESKLTPGVPARMSLEEAYEQFRFAQFWSEPSTRVVRAQPESRSSELAEQPAQTVLFAT